MNYSQAIEYLNILSERGSRPGLSRVSELLRLLGSPQNQLSIIHVAGTNGKGSVCKMLESILYSAGYKTGLYTSPCISVINECFRINCENITDAALYKTAEKIRCAEASMTDKPTEYEVQAAIAYEYFKTENCDAVIIETCMGGRLDATNAVKNVSLSVITNISFDHTQYLGGTIAEIAYEKAGIIKKGCPAVFGGDNNSAVKVMESTAAELSSELTLVNRHDLKNISYSPDGTYFDFGCRKNIFIPLLGTYQPRNAATALTAVDRLNALGFKISEDSVYTGLSRVTRKAGFEMLSKSPMIIYDGAHNPHGMEKAAESIREYFSTSKIILLMGVMADKDYRKMTETIAPLTRKVITVTPNTPRALNADKLARYFTSLGVSATPCSDIKLGVNRAIKESRITGLPLMILGTLYFYKDVTQSLAELLKS